MHAGDYDYPARIRFVKRLAAMTHRIVITILLVVYVSTALVHAQISVDQVGTSSLTEGYRYMVGFPQVWPESTEKPMPQPMQLLISSRTRATVRITTPAVVTDVLRIDKEYVVEPNRTLRIPISTAYMNVASEQRSGLGIQVTSDRPITVTTYQAWLGNGETARHLPVEGWGTTYYSMNFYTDQYGELPQTRRYRPSQILVIANRDSTMVSYTPTVATEGGIETKGVKKGETKTVRLQRGETYLIKSAIDEPLVKDFLSDLSGTLITSNHPIGVVSGHTKVAIMRMPDFIPPTGLPVSAHFVRNNVHDVMHPVALAGKRFVTVPCMYTATRRVGQQIEDWGYDDDRGDVIRVTATEDNTWVRVMRKDGGALTTKFVIPTRGESRLELALEDATYWDADKPILMAQYGKSYARILPPKVEDPRGNDKHSDHAQGHPTVDAGMPMFQTVPPIERWVDYAAFDAPEGMHNFLNIVCNQADLGKIELDGRTLLDRYGNLVRRVSTSEYSTLRVQVTAGYHVMKSLDPSVRWMAWNYGSLDGLQQGRAYGAPVGIDLVQQCNDSIIVEDQRSCGNVKGQASIVSDDTTCGSLFAIAGSELTNYRCVVDSTLGATSRTGAFVLTVIDPLKDASAIVRITSRSGRYLERAYNYRVITIQGARTACTNTPTTYMLQGTGASETKWSVSSHGVIVGSDSADSVVVRWDVVPGQSDTAFVSVDARVDGCPLSVVYRMSNITEMPIASISETSAGRLVAEPSDATSYQWLDGDRQLIPNATARTYEPRRIGSYYAVVSRGQCADTSDRYELLTVSVDDASAPATNVLSPKIESVVTTPTDCIVNTNGVHHQSGRVDVLTLDGRRVASYPVESQARRVRFSTLSFSVGAYIVVLSTQQGSDQRLMFVVE